MTDGYARYSRYLETAPELVLEWHDSESEARGWLVINSLRGGAAGGGTRMRRGATREEALFLAKTMEIKFGVAGPPIGGAKSVIDFDPRDPRKPDVLRRWFRAIGPWLKLCYGTGGDLAVDEVKEVIPLTAEVLGLKHPQEGVARGHLKASGPRLEAVLTRLKQGVELEVSLPDVGRPLPIADLVTGFGVASAVRALGELRGRELKGLRVLVEGFGAVGGPAAYYLAKAGARIVGVLSRGEPELYRYAVDERGLDLARLLGARQGAHLPRDVRAGDDPMEFWAMPADVFVPAAASHTLTPERLERLAAGGVSVIASGANNPFADPAPGDTSVQRLADSRFTLLPDFIANCGMARVFSYLMQDDAVLTESAILGAVDATVRGALERLLANHPQPTGLLDRAYAVFVP